jgi:hypothetical protein
MHFLFLHIFDFQRIKNSELFSLFSLREKPSPLEQLRLQKKKHSIYIFIKI